MKKNVYFLLALLLIGLSACDNAPKFKVQGEINGAEDKMLYLEASGLDGIVALDSAKLGSSGSFSFAQKRPESPEFYRLRLDNKVINFAVDSTETVSVKAEINDFATAYRIEGSENNLKIKELCCCKLICRRMWTNSVRTVISLRASHKTAFWLW